MIENPARDPRRSGLIGQHHVDAVGVELGNEIREFALVTGELHGRLVLEHGTQDIIAHQLRKRVHDADMQPQRTDARRLFGRPQDLAANGEDFLGIAENELAKLGQRQRTSAWPEQRLAQCRLQQLDLRAHRRLRDFELVGRPTQAALFRHGPEVSQVVVIEKFRAG